MRSVRCSVRVLVAAAALVLPAGFTPVPSGGAAIAAAQEPREPIVPFKISVPDAVLTDLNDRLARTRFPDEIEGSGWDYGTNLSYLRELVTYWRTTFDWRAQERRLNALPQFTT